jgi:hypothetical protein
MWNIKNNVYVIHQKKTTTYPYSLHICFTHIKITHSSTLVTWEFTSITIFYENNIAIVALMIENCWINLSVNFFVWHPHFHIYCTKHSKSEKINLQILCSKSSWNGAEKYHIINNLHCIVLHSEICRQF